jgi:hypothetical protein
MNELLNHPEKIDEKNQLSKQFVNQRTGATKKIIALIEKQHMLK